MPNLLDILDNSYQPSGAYSFEFRDRDSLTGKVGFPISELFFLLPPEEYSIQEGYKITVNKTISGAWIDDFGNDFKNIKISGSLYSYYVGTPAKTSLAAEKLPPFVRNLKNQAFGLADEFKKLAGSFSNQVGLDIPGLEIISGLDEFFKLRYILSRFRDTKPKENLTSDQAIVKKFPDIGPILTKVKEGKKLFTDIAIIYHDYDDNNHYEVVFNDFSMSRSAKDPFTIMYSIQLTGIKEFANQYSGIGQAKRKEDPFSVLNNILNSISEISDQLIAIINLPTLLLTEIAKLIDLTTSTADGIKNIIKNFGVNAQNEISKISESGLILQESCQNFLSVVTENAFPTKYSEQIDDVVEKYENEEDGYLITDENYLSALSYGKQLEQQAIVLNSIDNYFSDYISEITFDEISTLNQDDFDIEIENSNQKQENILLLRDKYYYQVIEGDTLQNIANKFYGNYEQYKIISEINDLSNSDFEDDAMAGKNIIIPSLYNVSAKETSFNLVYYPKKYIFTPRERQIQILGNDISLNENRQFIVDGSGDLALIYGEDCYIENIIDRIKYVIGSLNPIHPNWGISIEIGSVPASITLSKLYDSIEQQVSLDPRTEFVYIDREKSSIIGDTVNVQLYYKPINGYEKVINISDIVAGLII